MSGITGAWESLQCHPYKMSGVTWKENTRDHAREDDEPHGEELEVARQQGSGLGVGKILGRQGALDNHLEQGNPSVTHTNLQT